MTKRIGRSNGLSGVPKACTVNLAAIIRKIKANLKGPFSIKGVRPIPEVRRPNHPVDLYHFNAHLTWGAIEWKTFNMETLRSSKEAIEDAGIVVLANQLVVSESPVILHAGAAACALVVLYDRQRKVGAAIHIDAESMYAEYDAKMISLALYKMGVLKGNHLLNVEARILGAEWIISGGKDMALAWVKEIRSFLEDCSVQVLPENVGKTVEIKFDLRDGQIEYCDLLWEDY
jgi:chemotaxis receptor (MCP) glutamine deamidase CheD